MKKLLSILLTLVLTLTVLPIQSLAAKQETVTLYGNKFSVHTKQVCFVKGGEDDNDRIIIQVLAKLYEPSASKYYYVGNETVDFKLVAEKLPELQSISAVMCDVKNTAALADMKDLVKLGLYGNAGAEGLGFLKKMTGLKSFRYENDDCISINPISFLKKLKELYLDVGWISDIKALKGLTELTDLHLEYFAVEDLSALKKMKNLRKLYVSGYKLADISALKKLSKLRELSLNDTQMVSAKELSGLSQITSLELLNCSVSDFDGIGDMKNLKEFRLVTFSKNNKIISTLTKMTHLKSLDLMFNDTAGLGDCSFLKNHKNLKELSLHGCNITNISPLKGLTKLEYLDLGGNPISDISTVKNFKGLYISRHKQHQYHRPFADFGTDRA